MTKLNARRIWMLLVQAVLVFVTGCTLQPAASPSPAPPPTPPLSGVTWRLVTLYGTPAVPGVTLTIDADSVSGYSGCNTYGGRFQVAGAALTITELTSTLMICENETLMRQESQYLLALKDAHTLARAGDTLTLTTPEGALVFKADLPAADVPLEGTRWQLSLFTTGDTSSSPLAGTSLTLELAKGQLRGRSGCNTYTGSYSLSGATLSVANLTSTKMACDEAVMQQESVYLGALASTQSFRLESGVLYLTHAGGELAFTAAP